MVTLPSHAAQTVPSGRDQLRLAPWRHQLHVRWVSIYFRWRHCFFSSFYRSLSSSSSSVTSNANGLYWWQIQNRSWQNDLCGFSFRIDGEERYEHIPVTSLSFNSDSDVSIRSHGNVINTNEDDVTPRTYAVGLCSDNKRSYDAIDFVWYDVARDRCLSQNLLLWSCIVSLHEVLMWYN